MNAKLLYISKLYYSLYSLEDKFIISIVFFHSYIDTNDYFWLQPEDRIKYPTCGSLYSLVELIRKTPEDYKHRIVPRTISNTFHIKNQKPKYDDPDNIYHANDNNAESIPPTIEAKIIYSRRGNLLLLKSDSFYMISVLFPNYYPNTHFDISKKYKLNEHDVKNKDNISYIEALADAIRKSPDEFANREIKNVNITS
ncbi:hypothetical protein FJU30_17370 [Affinibrenneria salicis]|uniref:Uncharacterized protein n=1 Tax=Affinibrenneria salicis TaxID=2590031 RepID=A0A5J5FXI4_9GAMM|nr:hypothetical protein [Affinibrenneria salicis]KAA8998183.1 hypothetical protein FJU30_17370 [Affinibrenneria salicis]